MNKKTETLESKEQPTDIKMHENGILYKEIKFDGLDEPLKLFNSIKPQRLDGETYTEYKIRRKFTAHAEKTKNNLFYNPHRDGLKQMQEEFEKANEIKDPEERRKAYNKIKTGPRPYINNNK